MIEVAALCLAGACALITAAAVLFGESGLVGGLAVFGVAMFFVASERAKKLREGGRRGSA